MVIFHSYGSLPEGIGGLTLLIPLLKPGILLKWDEAPSMPF